MNISEAVSSVLSKYATFEGRARRSEYWYWTLALILAYFVILILTIATKSAIISILAFIFFVAIIIPSLAVTIRRLHDTGRSGWWWFIGFVPFVGAIVLLVFECQDSQPGQNQFGPSPKGFNGQVPPAPYYPPGNPAI